MKQTLLAGAAIAMLSLPSVALADPSDRAMRFKDGGPKVTDTRDGGRNRGGDVEIRVRKDGDWRRPEHRDRIVRRGHRYQWGPGVTFYMSDGYYYGECGWLKRRAKETGDRIWRKRYERCRDFS